MYLEMWLWVIQKGERVLKNTLQLVILPSSVLHEAVSTPNVLVPPHAGEPKRMKSPEPWSRNLKAANRNQGISLDGTKLGYLAFRCMSGRQHGRVTERLACVALGWITLGSSSCCECIVKVLGYWMVSNSAISSAHSAVLGCCILRVQAKRMESQCLLYLISEQKSDAFWVVQAIRIGFVIMLVITRSRKPTSMSMT